MRQKVPQVSKVSQVPQAEGNEAYDTRGTRATRGTLAFTLIELLVVISIIGILITLSAVAFQGAKASARDAKRKADLEDIRSSLEIYRTDCARYPSALSFGSPLTGNGSSSSCAVANTYHSSLPRDPQYPTYTYTYSASGGGYTLCGRLETQTGSTPSGCGSCPSCNYSRGNP